MDSIIVVSERAVPLESLKVLISDWNGKWDDDPTLNHGVIERGSAYIFCNRPDSVQIEYSSEEITEFVDRFGITPQNVVVIDIGRADGSQELAFQVADCIVQRWGGFVDDNGIFNDVDPEL